MTDSEKDRLKRSRTALESELRAAGAELKVKSFRCLWHDDKHASAGIFDKEGLWYFKCQGCKKHGDVIDVMAHNQGKAVEDILRGGKERDEPKAKKRVYPTVDAIIDAYKRWPGYEDCYAYTDPDTRRVDIAIVRIKDSGGDKQFIQHRPVAGGFESGGIPTPWPLFNRTRIRTAKEVWVVEGEKKVKALHRVGQVGASALGGANATNPAKTDWSPLAGKVCFLWPDNDPVKADGKSTGIVFMQNVAVELAKLEPRPVVLWIDPTETGVDEKGDVVDFLEPFEGDAVEAGRALDAIRSIATETGPVEALSQLFEDIISGKRRAIPWPSRSITNMTRALMPGMVTCICGDPGCGKSLQVLEAASYWHRNRIPLAMFAMEDDLSYHLNRVLAQLEDRAELTDDLWVSENPDEARAAIARHREFITSFGSCIDTCPDHDVTLDNLFEWIQRQCASKKRIIIVDPVTAADSGAKPWIADRKFILQAKSLVRASGASLILVTHPKTGIKNGSSPLHGMAGGQAYPRFSHTVMWLTRHEKPETVTVNGPFGRFTTTINRTMRIGKARNGPGSGAEIAFNFDGKSLRLVEQGIIIDESGDREPAEVGADIP